MGNSWQGLKQARRVVEDCMNNVHPIYHLKRLMIQKELAKDPALQNEDWSRFLPKFEKKNVQRRKPHKVKKKGAYTPFPPPQQPSKIDQQLETGEYFASQAQRAAQQLSQKKAKASAKAAQKRQEREAMESKPPPAKKAKKSTKEMAKESAVDVAQRVKSQMKTKKSTDSQLSDFVQGGSKKKSRNKKSKES